MSAVTFNPFSGASGFDNTQSRQELNGNVAFTGTYVTGGLTPNWGNLTDLSGERVLVDATTTGNAALITNVSVTSNVFTIWAQNSLITGQSVEFFNVSGNATVLNGNIYPVSSITTQNFTVAQVASNTSGNVSTTGYAVTVKGPNSFWAQSISGSGLTYAYNKTTANLQVFNGNVELANGSNAATLDKIDGLASYVREI
jgi:hypothetical protein